MSTNELKLESLLQEVLQQPSAEQALQILNDNLDYITEEFLESLGDIGMHEHNAGNFLAALSIFSIAYQAAELSGNAHYRIRFLAEIGAIAEEAGQTEFAIQTLLQAREEADKLITGGEGRAISDFINASLHLTELEMQRNNLDEARQLLGETRQRCHELASITGELWVNLHLANVCLQQKDMQRAKDYATLVVQLFTELREDQTYDPPVPDKMMAYSLLCQIASIFYYDLEDFENAATVAKQAVYLEPQEKDGYFLLGISQLRLNQFEAAAETWESAIALDSAQAAYYTNYAATLTRLDHLEEAVIAMDEAIRLKPDELRYYMTREQIYQQLNQHKDAISDFTQLLSLCEQNMGEDEPSIAPPKSHIEYERQMPANDLVDLARMARIQSFRALGRLNDALMDISCMIEQGDEITKSTGYCLQGELYEESGCYAEAIAAYTVAIQIRPDDTLTRQRRADAYISQERFDDAIPDLAFIAHREREPEAALERLTNILKKRPNHLLARKWRGYTYQEAWRPSKAEEDLTNALQSLPADPEIYLWRGLARITFSPLPEEEDWNKSFNLIRVKNAIEDLGSAVHFGPDNSEALMAYKWLVDRASTDDLMHEWLIFEGDRENGLFSVLPYVREPIERAINATNLSQRRHWEDSIKELTASQRGLMEAGLPVWATRLHIYIADNYLRLYELQLALDHLVQAEKKEILQAQPLTTHLQPYADEINRRRTKFGGGAAGIEVDYLGVYGIGFKAFTRKLNLLKAQAFVRIGDMDEALSALGDVNEYFDDIEQELAQGTSFQSLLAIIQILRDAHQYEHAVELLIKLEPFVQDNDNSIRLFSTAGTVCEAIGSHETARQYFQRVHEIATTSARNDFVTISLIQLAGNYFYCGQFQEAFDILDSIPIDQEALSERDQYAYYYFLAEVLRKLGRNTDAQAAILQVLSIVESTRGKLTLYDTRISWQASQESLYRIGVLTIFENSDALTAVELVERSKARAFVDQLVAGHLPLPASAGQLQEVEDNILEKKGLLIKLVDSLNIKGTHFIDYEVVRELENLDNDVKLLEETDDGLSRLSISKITDELTKIDASLVRLHQQMEEARLANINVARGGVLSFDELRQELKV